jgi:hypothetical protein
VVQKADESLPIKKRSLKDKFSPGRVGEPKELALPGLGFL